MSSEEINKLKSDSKNLAIARELITHEGFYNYWFEKLAAPEFENKTKAEIFDFVNDQYKKVFNQPEGKYSNYKSFQVVSRRTLKNNRL